MVEMNIINDFKRSQFPQYLVGAYRRLMGLPEQEKVYAKDLMRKLVEVLE